jgi:replicative superfamily II helicase
LQSVHFFDQTYRPVPLTLHVIGKSYKKQLILSQHKSNSLRFIDSGYNNVYGNKTFLFDKSLDEKVVEVVRKYSPTKQILIFCCSKKGTETLSALLASILPRFAKTSSLHRFNDENLDNLISKGFAYHHAGICFS